MSAKSEAKAVTVSSNFVVFWLVLMAKFRSILNHLNWLSLKPHGDKLCTPGACFWIACARMAILTMASSEALSWGYLGYCVGGARFGWLAAFCTAAAFAILVWVLDATFITLDWERAFYEEQLLSKEEGSSSADKPKLLLGVVMRIGMVFITLTVSAPFLSQIVFSSDIEAAIRNHNAAVIAAARQRVLEPYVSRLNQLRATLRDTQQLSILESQGLTKRGVRGIGPAARMIERRIDDLKKEIQSAEATLQQQALHFDATDSATLAKQYKIAILGDGIEARGQALAQLVANPQYTKADLAIKAFLALLFAGLVLLKVFQPRSIRIYYSEQLQDVYDQFTAGRFNAYLETVERPQPEGKGMKPLRFEDWAMNIYPVIREEDEKNKRNGSFERQHAEELARLTSLLATVEADVEPRRVQVQEAKSRVDALEQKLAAAAAEHDALRAQLDERRHSQSVLQDTIRSLGRRKCWSSIGRNGEAREPHHGGRRQTSGTHCGPGFIDPSARIGTAGTRER